MRRTLNITVRVITLGIVAFPFFAWFALQIQMPHTPQDACAGDSDCMVDTLDLHTTP